MVVSCNVVNWIDYCLYCLGASRPRSLGESFPDFFLVVLFILTFLAQKPVLNGILADIRTNLPQIKEALSCQLSLEKSPERNALKSFDSEKKRDVITHLPSEGYH